MVSELPAPTTAGDVTAHTGDSLGRADGSQDLSPHINITEPSRLMLTGEFDSTDLSGALRATPGAPDEDWPSQDTLDPQTPEKLPPTQIARVSFLEDGDTDTAKQILDILHDPKNRSAYVSPYTHYKEDPECEDIFNKVKNQDYKIAAAFDQDNRVVGTITLHYDPDRAHVVTWYLGGVASDLQGQGLGPTLYEEVAALTFDTPRYDGAETQLILGKVILKSENYHRQYSEATRKEFPGIYRMLMDLKFVEHIGTQKPSIATVNGDGYLPVALFQIGREDFAAYLESKERPDDGQ